MQAGKLRHRLTLQVASEAVNEYGEKSQTWTAAFNRWGAVEPLTGRELIKAQEVQSTITHRITMRGDGLETLTTKHRVKFGERFFGIESIVNKDERGAEITLMAKELTSGEG